MDEAIETDKEQSETKSSSCDHEIEPDMHDKKEGEL